VGELAKTLSSYPLVAIDTNIFIYYLQKDKLPAYHRALLPAFRNMENGEFQGVTSVLTLTEILTLPQKLGRKYIVKHYYLLLKNFPNLSLFPITEAVALRAAEMRGKWGLKTPDALHIAAAVEAGAKAFFTNDRSLGKIADTLDVVYLSDFVSS